MYDPKDEYIQNCISRAHNALSKALHETTNKEETKSDISKMLKTLGFDLSSDDFDMYFK